MLFRSPVNAHPSETALDDWPFDAVIDNDASPEDLRQQVLSLIPLR